jgi:hypothetical protein
LELYEKEWLIPMTGMQQMSLNDVYVKNKLPKLSRSNKESP